MVVAGLLRPLEAVEHSRAALRGGRHLHVHGVFRVAIVFALGRCWDSVRPRLWHVLFAVQISSLAVAFGAKRWLSFFVVNRAHFSCVFHLAGVSCMCLDFLLVCFWFFLVVCVCIFGIQLLH